MKKKELISMLNNDLKEEHAAIIRYLAHGWLEGEDTPLGASLISRSREEMWHMHWLGMIIGQLGGEPDLVPAPYPYDPKNRATIFKSYVEYEERLVPHYTSEAYKVDKPHIKRVLLREAWESAIHARKFQRMLKKLRPSEAKKKPGGNRKLPVNFLKALQADVTNKYNEMLHHIRHSWVFQKKSAVAWQLMDQAMEKMRHIAHFAEDIGSNGILPDFIPGFIERNKIISKALKKSAQDVRTSYNRHRKLQKNKEFKKHEGLVINLDLTTQQENYQEAELKDIEKNR